MNNRLVFLNTLLGLATLAIGWRLWANYAEDQAQREAFLRRAAQASNVPGHQPSEAAKPVQAASYLEVAQRMLFSKDRNPNVVIELPAEPPPPPPPPVPPFPAAYGMLSFGGEVIILLADNGKQKGYHLGDSVGPFKLSAIKGEELTFEWNGQTFKKTLAELKKLAVPTTDAAPTVAGAKPSAATTSITSLSPQEQSNRVIATQVTNDAYKQELSKAVGPGGAGMGDRPCDPNDNSPAGTTQGGYRKRVTPTPFGSTCIWEPVR